MALSDPSPIDPLKALLLKAATDTSTGRRRLPAVTEAAVRAASAVLIAARVADYRARATGLGLLTNRPASTRRSGRTLTPTDT
jgi:hypothetical protein